MDNRKHIIKNNVKISSDIASTMYSSRFFNSDICIENPSTNRNIFISHKVLPSTLNHSNSCNCNVKKENEDKSNILVKNNSNNNRYIKLSNFSDNLKLNMNDRLRDKQKIKNEVN